MSSASAVSAVPQRFREAEARGARLGRPLRQFAGVGTVDESLMAAIGHALVERDEPGARLAHAMRLPAGDGERVTLAEFRSALEHGVAAGAPAALSAFFATVEPVPDWVDWDLIERGQRVYHRFGRNAADVLLQLSLVGGYRFGGPTDLLVATGALTGDATVRRLAETQYWTTSLSAPGAMRRDGEGWRLTVHVRLMHALVNHRFTPGWDVARWGLPVNQADLAATLGLFDAAVLLGVRALGVPVNDGDSRAVMHLWKYVGWLLGVDERFLVDSERDRHRINYHLLLAQADISPAGPLLAQSIVEAQRRLHYRRFARVQGVAARERLLSMLTVFLGPRSMRELGLPLRPPWAHAYLIPLNTWRYRTTPGRRRLDAWSSAVSARLHGQYFGETPRRLGDLR